jgi:hypothetical protein
MKMIGGSLLWLDCVGGTTSGRYERQDLGLRRKIKTNLPLGDSYSPVEIFAK